MAEDAAHVAQGTSVHAALQMKVSNMTTMKAMV